MQSAQLDSSELSPDPQSFTKSQTFKELTHFPLLHFTAHGLGVGVGVGAVKKKKELRRKLCLSILRAFSEILQIF